MEQKFKNQQQQPQRSIIKDDNLNAIKNKLIDNNNQARLPAQQYYKGINFRKQLTPHCKKKFNWLQKKVLKELSKYCKGFWGIFKCRRHHIKRAKLVIEIIEDMKPKGLEEFIYNINLIQKIILNEAYLLRDKPYSHLKKKDITNSYFQKNHPKARYPDGGAIPLFIYMHNRKNNQLKNSSYMKTLRKADILCNEAKISIPN